ncbi:MAG: hypothetical protein KL801_20455 [Mesorhizobium sp.]|nr:hypothetical protein [Mesorhizobium sp.]
MDSVRQAIARQLEAERNHQSAFRQADAYASGRDAACRQFKVNDLDLYLVDVIIDQSEDCLTLFVWPSAIFHCEVDRETHAVGEIKLDTLADYMRTARGGSAKRLAIVLEIARIDHKHR